MSSSPAPLAAVCQVRVTPDKEANFSACKRLVEEAKERGACMVFLPEAFDYIGSSREETLSLSESLEGDTISRYTQLARFKKNRFMFISQRNHFEMLLEAVKLNGMFGTCYETHGQIDGDILK